MPCACYYYRSSVRPSVCLSVSNFPSICGETMQNIHPLIYVIPTAVQYGAEPTHFTWWVLASLTHPLVFSGHICCSLVHISLWRHTGLRHRLSGVSAYDGCDSLPTGSKMWMCGSADVHTCKMRISMRIKIRTLPVGQKILPQFILKISAHCIDITVGTSM